MKGFYCNIIAILLFYTLIGVVTMLFIIEVESDSIVRKIGILIFEIDKVLNHRSINGHNLTKFINNMSIK